MQPTPYLNKAINKQKLLIANAKKTLKKFEPYDAIVGAGLSGALAIPLIALSLNKRFCIVRKGKHSTHSSQILEGNLDIEDSWVFVDDLIDTGKTFRRVFSQMREYADCRGLYLYDENDIITTDVVRISERSSIDADSKTICRIQKILRNQKCYKE